MNKNPRDGNTWCTMYCKSEVGALGDTYGRRKLVEYIYSIDPKLIHSDHILEPYELVDIALGLNCIVQPLYLYEDSLSVVPFKHIFGEGQVGVVYVTPDDITNRFGKVTHDTIKQAMVVLDSEVQDYSAFLAK